MRGICRATTIVHALLVAMALAVGACSKVNPNYCLKDEDCGRGRWCDTVAKQCQSDLGGNGGAGGDGGVAPSEDAALGGDDAVGGAGGGSGVDARMPDAPPPTGCGSDDDCRRRDPGHPICENRVCTGCASNAQCSAAKPICGPNRRCAACAGDGECAGLGDSARAVCDTTSGMCVRCVAHAQCPQETPLCGADRRCTGCKGDADCRMLGDGARAVCDTGTGRCVQCVSSAGCPADKPICGAGRTCGGCQGDAECKTLGDAKRAVCDKGSGRCVECVSSVNCSAVDAPVCDTGNKACVKCATDAQCAEKSPNPGVCLENGQCPSEGEAIFVENRAGCSLSGGTASTPVCGLAAVKDKISAGRRLVVVRGGVDGGLALSTTPGKVVIVGQKGGSGDAASVLAVGGTALQLTGGEVLLRDIGIDGGNNSMSASVEVTGAAAKLTLLRARVAGAKGIGVRATSGAQITIDKTVLQSNAGAGLAVNGAVYNVTNSVLAANGFGVKFEGAVIPPSRFVSNTVVANVGYAGGCASGAVHVLSGSIVVGIVDTCAAGAATNSVTTMPDFDPARPYHLRAPLPCPGGDPAMFPPDDIDGQPRMPPIDCGADQFAPP